MARRGGFPGMGGGMNMQSMMAQAQKMQQNMVKMQDLVVAAVNEALNTANAEYEQEMGKVTGGMNLGGMF